MEPEETPTSRPPSTKKAEPTLAPTEAELSRIAREAVRQPADPRLDKELERMGLTESPTRPAVPTNAPVAPDPAVGGLLRRISRLESTVRVLAIAVGILAVAVAALLLR